MRFASTYYVDARADGLLYAFCRHILKEIIDKKEGMGDIMKHAFFSLTEAVYSAGGSVKNTIFDNVETATIKVNGGLDNVAGVKIPKFAAEVIPGETKMDLTGGFDTKPCPHARQEA